MLARSFRVAHLGAVAIVVSLAVCPPASGATVSAAAEGTTSLPGILQTGPSPLRLSSASDDAVAFRYGVPRSSPIPLVAHSLTDGHALVTMSTDGAGAGEPFLDGDARVEPVTAAPGGDPVAAVTRVLSTGVVRSTISVKSTDRYLAAGNGWVLTERPEAVGQGEVEYRIRVLTANNQDRPLAGDLDAGSFNVLSRQGHNVLVDLGGRIGIVNIDAASAVAVTPEPSVTVSRNYANGPIGAVTSTGVWWSTPDFYSQSPRFNGRPVSVVYHADLDGGNVQRFEVSGAVRDLFPLGDALAGLVDPESESGALPRTRRLVWVEAGSGELRDLILDDVLAAIATPDGHVVAATEGGATGRLVSVSAIGSTRAIGALPRLNSRISDLAVRSGRLVAAVHPEPGGAAPTTLQVQELIGDAWTPQAAGVTAGSESPTLVGRGDVLLADLGGVASGRRTWTLTWPGGSRTIDSWSTTPRLGRDGHLVARLADDTSNPTQWVVEEVRTGTEVHTIDDAQSFVDIDTDWVWSLPKGGTVLTGEKIGGSGETVTRDVPAECSASQFTVWDRNALLSCRTSGPSVYDLHGERPPYTWRDASTLGPEYLVGRTTDSAGVGRLVVRQLGTGVSRTYGETSGTFTTGVIDHDPSARRLVYVDQDAQPVVVDLSWLTETPAQPDLHAPRLTSTSGSLRTSPVRDLTFSWTFADPVVSGEETSGVASYDVRYQQGTKLGGPYGAWVSPASMQATTGRSVSLKAVLPGRDTCFAVRARDRDGNLSDWSTPRCSLVDGVAPSVTSASAGSRMATSTRLTFRYLGKDAVSAASYLRYDVAYRVGRPGQALGSWSYPSSWQGRAGTSVVLTRSAGDDVCFVVRVTDRAGNKSAWSRSRCTAVPYDDRALSAKGNVKRGTSSGYYAKTWTTLQKGSSLSRANQRGLRVAVTALRGPGQGAFDVYLGSRKLGRINLASSSSSLTTKWLTAPKTTTGKLRLVRVGSAPVRIDAVAVTRN